MDKVSIVIPVYNAEKYLVECIESTLNQTYKDIEVIAVNDGSTDNSLAILQRYSDKIKIISKQNGGQGSALNVGINEMKGQWFKLLGDDDVLYPNAVNDLVNETHNFKNKENFICYANYDVIDSDGHLIRQSYEQDFNQMDSFEFNVRQLDSHFGNDKTTLIHRSVFERFGKYNEELGYSEDYELCLRLCIQHNLRFHFIPKVLAKIRHHQDRLTVTTRKESRKKDDEIRELVLSRIDPQLRQKYLLALDKYQKNKPFKVKAVTAIGGIMTRSLPFSVTRKIIKFYWRINGRDGR